MLLCASPVAEKSPSSFMSHASERDSVFPSGRMGAAPIHLFSPSTKTWLLVGARLVSVRMPLITVTSSGWHRGRW